MIELQEQSDHLVQSVSLDFQRYLLNKIDWKNRLIGIKGARGTGKTTMLLQKIHQAGLPANKALYLSLDDLYFSTHTLVETGKKFYKEGGQTLILDEVHKYQRWSLEIKNLYDQLPDLQIIFTGSSILDIARQEADLSRRALMYELPGLSFREYLHFTGIRNIKPISLAFLINEKKSLRNKFDSKFRPFEHFREYLQKGYYPFFKVSESAYYQKLQQLIRTIVEYDMAELKGFDIRNAKKLLQLLYIIAQTVPFKPNLSKLSEKSKIHRNSLSNYLIFLEDARLISLLYPSGISIATLQKPEKVYLNNSNLLYALSSEKPSFGTVREVFFFNQLNVNHQIKLPKTGDFEVDGKYTFEVGGKQKHTSQIKGLENAWIVKDDLEYPVGTALPLWAFGLLY